MGTERSLYTWDSNNRQISVRKVMDLDQWKAKRQAIREKLCGAGLGLKRVELWKTGRQVPNYVPNVLQPYYRWAVQLRGREA